MNKKINAGFWLATLAVGFLGGSLSQFVFSDLGSSVIQNIKKVGFAEPMTARVGDPSVPATIRQDPKSTPSKDPFEVCEKDRARFCPDIGLNAPGMAGCLVLKSDSLEKPCFELLGDQIKMRNECGEDVKKFCADVPSGKGRVAQCLEKHKSQISDTCLKNLKKSR